MIWNDLELTLKVQPFFPVDGQTIWNALDVILKKQIR